MGDVDIPDEARRAAAAAIDQVGEQGYRLSPPGVSEMDAIRAAAPHIARAAQVAILREQAKHHRQVALELNTDDEQRSDWHNAEYYRLKAKADDLEAGGGQTEEVQGDA